jgi:hypothetical protein
VKLVAIVTGVVPEWGTVHPPFTMDVFADEKIEGSKMLWPGVLRWALDRMVAGDELEVHDRDDSVDLLTRSDVEHRLDVAEQHPEWYIRSLISDEDALASEAVALQGALVWRSLEMEREGGGIEKAGEVAQLADLCRKAFDRAQRRIDQARGGSATKERTRSGLGLT